MSYFGNNNGIDDTKQSRQEILEKANLMLNSMLKTLGSNYITSNDYAYYAVKLKALAFEAARIITNAEDIYNDLIFATTRPEFMYQNIETFLFFNSSYSFSNVDDGAARNFLLALIKAYFNGATKSSIEAALALGVDNKATVTLDELYLEGRANQALDPVPLQHAFLVSIIVENNNLDIVQLQNNITFLTNLIKPAHTNMTTRFVFSEPTESFAGRDTDVFNAQIFDYGYEDLRKNAFLPLEIFVPSETAYLISPTLIHTRYGPISNGSGVLIDDVSEVTVYVNGNAVTVVSVDALNGLITLADPIPSGATVLVSYSYLRRHFEYLVTNNLETVLNQFDSYDDTLPSNKYSSLIWSPTLNVPDKTPVVCDYKYSGFDALDTSLLNDPNTLVFNKVSSRDKLNDFTVFESYLYDDQPAVTLNYGVPLFVLRQELPSAVQDTSRTAFVLNDPMSLMNSAVSSLIGATTNFLSQGDPIQKVYTQLDVVSDCSGTSLDRLKPVNETAWSMDLDYTQDSDVYDKFNYSEPDNILLLNRPSNVLNSDSVLIVPPLYFNGVPQFINIGRSTMSLDDLEIEPDQVSTPTDSFSADIVYNLVGTLSVGRSTLFPYFLASFAPIAEELTAFFVGPDSQLSVVFRTPTGFP